MQYSNYYKKLNENSEIDSDSENIKSENDNPETKKRFAKDENEDDVPAMTFDTDDDDDLIVDEIAETKDEDETKNAKRTVLNEKKLSTLLLFNEFKNKK